MELFVAGPTAPTVLFIQIHPEVSIWKNVSGDLITLLQRFN